MTALGILLAIATYLVVAGIAGSMLGKVMAGKFGTSNSGDA